METTVVGVKKNGEWSTEEVWRLLNLINQFGQDWSSIRRVLNHRSFHGIKVKGRSLLGETGLRICSSKKRSQLNNSTKPQSISDFWSDLETEKLLELHEMFTNDFGKISSELGTYRPTAKIHRKLLTICTCTVCTSLMNELKETGLSLKTAWSKRKALQLMDELNSQSIGCMGKQEGSKAEGTEHIAGPVDMKKRKFYRSPGAIEYFPNANSESDQVMAFSVEKRNPIRKEQRGYAYDSSARVQMQDLTPSTPSYTDKQNCWGKPMIEAISAELFGDLHCIPSNINMCAPMQVPKRYMCFDEDKEALIRRKMSELIALSRNPVSLAGKFGQVMLNHLGREQLFRFVRDLFIQEVEFFGPPLYFGLNNNVDNDIRLQKSFLFPPNPHFNYDEPIELVVLDEHFNILHTRGERVAPLLDTSDIGTSKNMIEYSSPLESALLLIHGMPIIAEKGELWLHKLIQVGCERKVLLSHVITRSGNHYEVMVQDVSEKYLHLLDLPLLFKSL